MHLQLCVTHQGPEELIPPHLEIAHIPYARGGPYPGVYLFTAVARMVRPVTQLGTDTCELIGSLEQSCLDIRYERHLEHHYVVVVVSHMQDPDW